jgi:hypothetical protein
MECAKLKPSCEVASKAGEAKERVILCKFANSPACQERGEITASLS